MAHFISLAVTIPCCVSMLRSRGLFPHSPGHYLGDAVVKMSTLCFILYIEKSSNLILVYLEFFYNTLWFNIEI